MNIKQFIKDTKNADIEAICYKRRLIFLIGFMIIVDFFITLSIVEFAIQSPIHSDGIVLSQPRINVQTVKYGVMIKSIVLYGIAVGMAKRLTAMSRPAGGTE